jgi:hypothetical protein
MTPRLFAARRPFVLVAWLVAWASLGIPTPAAADVMTIDFNNPTTSNVGNYMQGMMSGWHPGGGVTVSGAVFQSTYTGDGHVVGPVNGNTVQPMTLGTTDGGVLHAGFDNFITNSNSSDRITMNFTGGMKIYAVSFDFQIFPDGTLSDGTGIDPSQDPNWPDFTFQADGQTYIYQLGVMPGQDGTYLHSPDSGPNGTELAPQYIGQSGVFYFPDGVTMLEFIDWPRTIGIDNFSLSDTPNADPPAPEPASILIWCFVLAGMFVVNRRLRRRSRLSPSSC